MLCFNIQNVNKNTVVDSQLKKGSCSILSHLTSENICRIPEVSVLWCYRESQTLFIGRHLTSLSILSLESFKQDLAAHQILVQINALCNMLVFLPKSSISLWIYFLSALDFDRSSLKKDWTTYQQFFLRQCRWSIYHDNIEFCFSSCLCSRPWSGKFERY